MSKPLFAVGFIFLSFAVVPEGWARLGPQYQMALGNPDGASTNSASRTKYLINQRAQYAISYNDDTHQANWVSWSYSLADDGTQARTDYWQTEELLPSGYLKIGTATFGTGWDRGHMCPSADRTKDLTNNQVTFRMSNIIPQASQNNQGLWANFEDYCRTLAADGDELLIISGPAQFTGSRLNNQMSIPGSVWKIAVEIPNSTSSTPANERVTTNARVIALLTPNTSTGLGPWQSYITSVEQIEAVTGFNFFNAITNRSVAIYLKNLVDTGTGPNSPTVITTFNPMLGSAGNTTVTISGYNFGTAPVVQFNGLPAAVQSSSATSITVTVPAGATSGYITVQGANGTDTSYEPFTVTAGSSPTVSITPNTLSGLTANQNSAGTAVGYALTGSLLTANVVVTAPPNFEVSVDGGVTFADTQSIAPDMTGNLGLQLYVRIKAGPTAGNVSGTITHTTSGTAGANLPISGTVLSTAPNLSLSTNSVAGLSALQNSPGTSRSYAVSGSNLTGNVTVIGSAGFEVSADNIAFGSSVALVPSSGILSLVPVYVRLASSATARAVSGTITHSGGGAAQVDLRISGDVASTAPSLTLSTNSVSGFTAVQNNPGGSKTYSVSGNFLTSAVTVGAPAGFEVGTNATVFTNSLVLNPSSGTLANTTIYVRLAASATTGSKSGSITHTGGGVPQQDISVSGNVSPPSSGGTNETLARWTFESFTNGTTGTTLAPVYPEAGLQTNSAFASGLHVSSSTAYTNFTGNGSAKALSANNWTTNDYFQFEVGMSGYQGLRLRFDQTGSGTGPAQFRISYSTNGSSYVTLTNYDVPKTNSTSAATWSSTASNAASTVSIDLSAVGDLNNSSRAYLRLTPRSTNSIGGAGVGTGGTSRIDNVIVEATTIGGSISLKPVITSGTTAAVMANNSFTYQITANNSPTYFSAAGLPAGLSIDNATGLISGTPTIPGTYSVLLTASNASGDGTATLVIIVNPQPAPVITSSTTASAAVNASFQYQITASNAPTSFTATGLPTGLSVDSNGLISGTPTTKGVYSVDLTASNAGGTGSATLTLTVNPDPNAPVIGELLSATGAVGAKFSYQILASNSPTAYLADNLPAGLVLDPLTGTISGTPTTAGVSTVVITAANAFGSDKNTLTITVLAPVITVSQADLSFTSKFGEASAVQTYDLNGSDLNEAITVLAPGNFEINSDGGTNYVNELTVIPAGDRTVNAKIRVRIKASAPLGESSGAVINSGANAVPKYVQLTGFSDVIAPTLDLSVWSLSGFSTKIGTPSLTQSYTLSGVGLNAAVTISAPVGFQISTDNTNFASSLVFTPDSLGQISAQEIFVRLNSATAGILVGSIEHTGGGAETKLLSVGGTVTTPIGPPIISPLSGSSYTNSSFTTKIAVGGSLPAISFGATNLPGSLLMNPTNGTITGIVPVAAGTNVFPVSATTQDGSTTNSYNLRVVSSAEQSAIPTSVVVNKFQNGLPDRVELLVIGDTNDAAPGPPVDMRGMILKDFAANRSTDQGGKYRFTTNPLWSSVKAGTLIVLSAGTQSSEQTNATNFVLRVNLGNELLFKQEAPGFDIDDFDMVMVKPANMGIEGFAGGIHAMAAGRITGLTIFGSFTGKKLRSDRELSSSRNIVYANASSLSGYNSSSSSAAFTDSASNISFGSGNTGDNLNYINSLRNLDQTPPVVTLNGNAVINLALGATYNELGATVTGGTSATATITGTVNTSAAGTYVITYSATDSSGNLGTATRTVNVAKGTPGITQWPTASPILAGQKLAASALIGGSNAVSGTFVWSTPSQVVTNSGTFSYPVLFTPTDVANYNLVTNPVLVTVNQGTPFESWAISYGLEGADLLPDSDPDRDGWSNRLEFVFGTVPNLPGGELVKVQASGGKITYFQRSGVTYTVRSSTNLTTGFNGTVVPLRSELQPVGRPDGYDQYEASLPTGSRGFLKVEATLTP